MAQLTASRTLVKSSPELWAECSDAAALARHLGAFGEIQITKLEPETAVAWEGEEVRGTVTLEPSGWGTRVVLTAEVPTPAGGVGQPAGDVPVPAAGERDSIAEPGPVVLVEPEPPASEPEPPASEPDPPASEPAPVVADEPDPVVAAEPARPGFLRRLFAGWRRPSEPGSDHDPQPSEDDTTPTPAASPDVDAGSVVTPEPFIFAEPVTPVEPVAPAEPVIPAEPDSPSAQVLVGALDSLGRAHRRPFSHG